MSLRVCVESDINELYPTPPEMATSPTYINIFLVMGKGVHLKVKIPSKDYEVHQLMYLLHKEIFHHFLNVEDPDPLRHSADIITFENIQNWQTWHNLWLADTPFRKNIQLEPITFFDDPHLRKYLILSKEKQANNTYLVKSRRDGDYYSMAIFEHSKISDKQSIDIYLGQLKTIQHPFIAQLRQVLQTTSKTYVFFDYAPYKMKIADLCEEKGGNNKKKVFYDDFNLDEVKTCVVEVVYALLFVEQKNNRLFKSYCNKLEISKKGHVLLRNQIWMPGEQQSGEEFENQNPLEFLLMLLNQICSQQLCTQTQIVDFFQYVHQLYEEDKASVKELFNHSFISKNASHEILGMGMPAICIKNQAEDLEERWEVISLSKRQNIYREYERCRKIEETYYSNQGYLTSPQHEFLMNNGELTKNQSQLENSIMSSNLSIRKSRKSSQREKSQKKTNPEEIFKIKRRALKHAVSPYQSVLRMRNKENKERGFKVL